MNLPQKWNLETLFTSKKLRVMLDAIKHDLQKLGGDLEKDLLLFQEISFKLREVSAFVLCRSAQDVNDTEAITLQDEVVSLEAEFEAASLNLDQSLATLDKAAFEKLLQNFDEIAFCLRERRHKLSDKLPLDKEKIITELSIDGYHGWSQLYDALMGEMIFSFQGEELSFGQLENKISHSDRSIRQEAFEVLSKGFQAKEALFAQCINHIAGFRLKRDALRGWDHIHKEPLEENRMERETLHAMWGAIDEHKDEIKKFLERKAQLLNLKQLAWYDVEAPVGSSSTEISYDKGAEFILNAFEAFSPKMATFAKKAFEQEWIEAEDRASKRPGGFCVDFPIKRESRIFMTYSNTYSNLSTLAHELGHAFHNEIVHPLPEMVQQYKMNVAETASTLAEMVIFDAAIQKAKDKQEKISLLNEQVSRTVAFLMNIQARFLFETEFYELRKKGYVLPEHLNELMTSAQKKAFANALEGYHPHFWAAKLHFYFTDVPFYNFPYTFGYLFSLALFQESKEDPHFEKKYIALLEDTGRLNVEELVKKHLGQDIRQKAFWKKAMQPALDSLHQFLDLI